MRKNLKPENGVWSVLSSLVCLVAFGFATCSGVSTAQAQDEDFDSIFEEMMKDFFPKDLLDEIESVREKEAGRNRNFYRDNPRFLEIKERQIVNRRKDRVEKQHPDNLKIFRPLASDLSKSVVSITKSDEEKERLVLGTVVSKDGLLVTKASELEGEEVVRCVGADNESFEAKVVKVDEANDLALLKSSRTLKPIEFEPSPMDEGTLLVSVENSNKPLAMGTLAVKPRSIIGTNRGFLGVEPGPAANGVLIKSVTRGSAAERYGVRSGDIVQTISGKPTRTVAELVREIGSKKKGDTVELAILRSGQKTRISARLDGRMMNGERAARFEMMRRLGTLLSERRDEFPSVMEHDSPILPDDCGGPVVDLEGKVIGINIARAGRTSTFALPISLVKKFVDSYRVKI